MVVVNRVRRIVRKIDPWTALKVSLVINFVIALAVVLGLIILWILLVNAGIPQGLEEIAKRLALLDDNATLVGNSEQLFSSVVFLAIFYMLAQTAMTTIGVIFYNLDYLATFLLFLIVFSYHPKKLLDLFYNC